MRVFALEAIKHGNALHVRLAHLHAQARFDLVHRFRAVVHRADAVVGGKLVAEAAARVNSAMRAVERRTLANSNT